ncbi:MAG: NAD(P)-binding domain-containing protein [Betaproteobacteria bacterium]|nr:NAD(P)-binding domain-containing protein [Betaproteobacteria bacterium]MDH3436350.1 NAD(P)-binding domain-containing protein [Betaproteobacteria bacterium]
MTHDVICLRPESDFLRAGVTPPAALKIVYRGHDDSDTPVLVAAARGVVIAAVGPKLPAALFENSAVKIVQVTGAGVDRVDEPALKRLGIAVCNVPGGSNAAVADYAVTTASVLLRRFAWADREIRAGNYANFRGRMMADNLSGLDGLVVGMVGLGTIGLAVARAYHQRGCTMLYFDPAPRDKAAADAFGAKAVPLEALLRASDVVSLHVPLLPAIRGMIGDVELVAMKPGAVLIQASRGGIVDEAALARHLASGHLGGAAVDVYSQEPPAANNPLLALRGDAADRLLLTPHVAGVTRQAMAVLLKSAWDNVEAVFTKGSVPLNRVY